MYAQLIKLCYSCQIIVYITLLISLILQVNFSSIFLPPANEVWGKVIFLLHLSVILFTGGGVVSQHALQVVSQHALQVSGGGGLSQHALQVSRPTPRGEVEGSGLGRGGLQAHTGWGGIPACTEADNPSPSRWLLLQVVRILLE